MKLVKHKWNMTVLSAVLFLLLIASIGAYGNGNLLNKQSSVPQRSQQELVERVNILRVLTDLTGGGTLKVRIQLHGSFVSLSAADWELERKSWGEAARFDVPLKAVSERGREVYRTDYTTAGAQVAGLLFREADEGRAYYTITLSGSMTNGLRQVSALAEHIQSALIKADHSVEWNATVQSEVSIGRDEAWRAVEKAVSELGQAVPLDRYEDDHTISVSYETDYMGEGVEMKGRNANLQAAIYEDVKQGTVRISYGTPLISGEY